METSLLREEEHSLQMRFEKSTRRDESKMEHIEGKIIAKYLRLRESSWKGK
jgi:hypothetical protein